MKTPLRILKRDLLALLKNPIALLVVGALMVLPGLYAWYCIVANWDPYANTGNVPIAVVNRDKGATSSLTGPIDVGKQVVEKLEGNDSIDWRFYDDEESALEATRQLECYAAIVLPEDLSEDVLGIFEGSSEQPTVYYYPNEKRNAVATKVADSAAQTLVRQINQNFSSTVNEAILEKAQDLAEQANDRADTTGRSARAELRDVQADLETVVASLDDASAALAGWRSAADGAQSALAATSQQLPSIRQLLGQGSSEVGDLRASTDAFERDLSATVLDSAATVAQLSAQSTATVSQAAANLQVVNDQLNALSEAASGDPDLQAAVDLLSLEGALIGGALSSASDQLADVDAAVRDMSGDVTSATKAISNDVMPQLSAGAGELSSSFAALSGAVGQFEPQVAQLQSVLTQTDGALASAQATIADGKELLGVISDNLAGTMTDLGAIRSALEIEELSQLLNVDPQSVGTFVSSPVQMETREVFPVSNYGTAVAPFYTNLALWIGCFILISLMKVEVDRTGFEEATPRQRYFGRWLLFVMLALVQSQVICGVDILLGIDCENPGLFMLAGAVCSFVYMNVIFSLVSTFRNVGKTLCILLLIMQVPGSSGMYPIQMMPDFFQFIHPALPFTYGINAMREALSGLYGTAYFTDLLILLAIVPMALLVGLALRPLMANVILLFDDEMRKTGFFASEEHGQGAGDEPLRGLMRALTTHDSFRDYVEERAWKFRRMYPRLRRVGSIALFALPFAFLVLMLPFNLALDLSVNVKLGALVAMVVVLLIVVFGLVLLEYIQRLITEETKLMGDELLVDLADFNYETLVAQADDARIAAEQEEERALERAADELLSVAPPLSDSLLAMIPAASTAAAKAQKAPEAKRKPRRGGATRDIFFTDMRLGFQSVIGVVVIMLLVITPSLYAWFNIAGSWDPYSNTGNLKVAVANEDDGYKGDLLPITINIGDTVVSQLRGNNSFDWIFVDEDQAVQGVASSDYYAAIVIPGDFSRNMMTYLVESDEYPDVVYYTNEKENPIAPIITQKGADSIQESIRVSFTQRVDQVVLGVAYDLLSYVTNPDMTSYVAKMSAHLDDATHDAKRASAEVTSLSSLASTVAGVVDATGVTLHGIGDAANSAESAVGEAKAGLSDASAAFSRAVSLVKGMLGDRDLDFGDVADALDTALRLLKAAADVVPSNIDDTIAEVETLKATHSSVDAAKFDAVIASLQNARSHAAGIPDQLDAAEADVDRLIDEARDQLDETSAYFNGSVQPAIDHLRSTASDVAAQTGQVVSGLKGAVSGLSDSTDGLSGQLNTLSDGLAKSAEKLDAAATNIEDTKARVAQALASGDLKQVEAVILGGDTEVMAGRLAAPIQEAREAIYPVANYGSSMAPFYTVLSLWVGALVMISTMRAHVARERMQELRQRYANIRSRHEFFGRYGIFGFISLLQSALVLLGDLLLFNIQCAHPVAFFLFGLFIGQVFCLIVYTLTELFGDVGKAVCVILLIMQVAASGGTFPVEMLNHVLANIVPFLPFFHAMCLLQECVAGIYWPAVGISLVALLFTVGFVLLLGLPLRRPFRKLNDFFEEQLEKTGYM